MTFDDSKNLPTLNPWSSSSNHVYQAQTSETASQNHTSEFDWTKLDKLDLVSNIESASQFNLEADDIESVSDFGSTVGYVPAPIGTRRQVGLHETNSKPMDLNSQSPAKKSQAPSLQANFQAMKTQLIQVQNELTKQLNNHRDFIQNVIDKSFLDMEAYLRSFKLEVIKDNQKFHDQKLEKLKQFFDDWNEFSREEVSGMKNVRTSSVTGVYPVEIGAETQAAGPSSMNLANSSNLSSNSGNLASKVSPFGNIGENPKQNVIPKDGNQLNLMSNGNCDEKLDNFWTPKKQMADTINASIFYPMSRQNSENVTSNLVKSMIVSDLKYPSGLGLAQTLRESAGAIGKISRPVSARSSVRSKSETEPDLAMNENLPPTELHFNWLLAIFYMFSNRNSNASQLKFLDDYFIEFYDDDLKVLREKRLHGQEIEFFKSNFALPFNVTECKNHSKFNGIQYDGLYYNVNFNSKDGRVSSLGKTAAWLDREVEFEFDEKDLVGSFKVWGCAGKRKYDSLRLPKIRSIFSTTSLPQKPSPQSLQLPQKI